MFLLNIYCIFLIHASILLISVSILFPRFLIIYTIIALNSFQVKFSGSFTMFLYLLYVSLLSFLFNKLCLEDHSSSLFVEIWPPKSGFVKFSWLGDLCLYSGWHSWILSLWRSSAKPSSVCSGVSRCLIWLQVACLLIFRVVFLFS